MCLVCKGSNNNSLHNRQWESNMSGRKIHDHKFFAGGPSKDSVLPKGVHHKHESGAEGAGQAHDYPDTTEGIKKVQESGISKIKGHAQKPGHRN